MEYIIYLLLFVVFILLYFLYYQIQDKNKVIQTHDLHVFELAAQATVDLDRALARQADQQRRVLKGKLSEELFPLMKDCPYLPADMRFFGNPIDYVVFDGLSDAKDDGSDFRDIIFIDVKTGNARLSAHQKKIKAAVQAGRVRWETIRMNDDGSITFERE